MPQHGDQRSGAIAAATNEGFLECFRWKGLGGRCRVQARFDLGNIHMFFAEVAAALIAGDGDEKQLTFIVGEHVVVDAAFGACAQLGGRAVLEQPERLRDGGIRCGCVGRCR